MQGGISDASTNVDEGVVPIDLARDVEIDRNLVAFERLLPQLMKSSRGEFALMRNQTVRSVHAKLSDALRTAHNAFPDGIFSVQTITDEPIDLGYYSHVGYPGE